MLIDSAGAPASESGVHLEDRAVDFVAEGRRDSPRRSFDSGEFIDCAYQVPEEAVD